MHRRALCYRCPARLHAGLEGSIPSSRRCHCFRFVPHLKVVPHYYYCNQVNHGRHIQLSTCASKQHTSREQRGFEYQSPDGHTCMTCSLMKHDD
ncbi:unnamed protein product [Urochloa humidicola]